MSEPLGQIIVPARFNGPPATANGGYVSGLLAAGLDGPVEVTLRRPPPLEAPMDLVAGESRAERRLLHGDTVVAYARPGAPLDAPPPAPGLDAARKASESYPGFERHGFPTCFVCGPDRGEHDGLRIFPGAVRSDGLVACEWRPSRNLAADGVAVDRAAVWAALDCPSYFGAALGGEQVRAVLGRMTAELVAPVFAGRPYVVAGWPLPAAADRRRLLGGSAVFDETGSLCALAQGLWIEV